MHSKYKTKTYNIHTKDKDKGIKTYHYRKIIKSQRKRAREEEGNREEIKITARNIRPHRNQNLLLCERLY